MGVLRDIGGPLVNGGFNLLGGALGASAQSKANKVNLQIARETNLANRDIAANANLMTQQMMREQFKYASPAEQRKMLEEAGYNPYLYGNQEAIPAGSPTASTGAAQVAPSVQPVDAFAKSISALSAETAGTFNILAQGRKANAEATAQNIDNITKAETNARTLESLGLTNEGQAIRNERDAALSPLQVENQQKMNEQIDEQNALLRVQAGLGRFDLNFLKPAQYNQLLEETKLAIQKQITEEEYRDYLYKMGKSSQMQAAASWLQAEVADYLKYSEREKNFAQASLSENQAEEVFQNLLPEDQIAVIKDAKVQGLLQDVLNKKISFYEAYQRAKMIHKNLDIKDFTNVERVWHGVIGMIKSLGFGSGSGVPFSPLNNTPGIIETPYR